MVDINLNNVQAEPIEVTGSLTAVLNKFYINTATATYTDPTPAQGEGFIVFVRNGTATVGGTGYSVVGTVIYRVFHSGAWSNSVHFDKAYFDTVYKATFSENTAFNKNFGTTSNTVCEGNDSRLSDSRISVIKSDITPFTSATTATDELAQTIMIPGGTLTTGDFLDILTLVSKTGTAGVKNSKVWINTSATLSGATQIALFENTTNAGSQHFFRSFAIKSNTTIRGLSTGTAIAAGYISTATLGTDITIPTLASNVYIMVSINRANSGDAYVSEFLKVTPQKNV